MQEERILPSAFSARSLILFDLLAGLVERASRLSPFIHCKMGKNRGTLIAIFPLFLHESAHDSQNFFSPRRLYLQHCRPS
jgi:hypothetical protein